MSLDTKQGLMFTFLFWVVSEIRGYSWSLYVNFVIKERAGFNKLTLKYFKYVYQISGFGGKIR